MEEIKARHRQEERALQARITQKKKSATKKTRKGVNDECDRLQRELDERHQAELAAASGTPLGEQLDNSDIQDPTADAELPPPQADEGLVASSGHSQLAVPRSQPEAARSKKPNRQKARLARRAAEQEAQISRAEQEAANLPDQREQERDVMSKLFEKLGLKELEIRPDGHCMYSAVASQLDNIGLKPQILPPIDMNDPWPGEDFRAVRISAANFIDSHPDDFSPFLEVPLDEYTRQIRDTAEWGGQLELQAIARAYDIDLNVVQADGRIEKIESGGDSDAKQIWLAYYRHSFGLGEHYNALTKIG